MTVDKSHPDAVRLRQAMAALVAVHVTLILARLDAAGESESGHDAIVEDYLATWIRGAGTSAPVMTKIAPVVRQGVRVALAWRRKVQAQAAVAETLARMGMPPGSEVIQ